MPRPVSGSQQTGPTSHFQLPWESGSAPVWPPELLYERTTVRQQLSLVLSTDVAEAQADDEGGTLIARKVGEAVQNTLGAVVTAIDIPLGRPGQCLYWVMHVA